MFCTYFSIYDYLLFNFHTGLTLPACAQGYCSLGHICINLLLMQTHHFPLKLHIKNVQFVKHRVAFIAMQSQKT